MPDKNAKADDLIPGRLKKSKSYHAEYGRWTYGELSRAAKAKPADRKARQMKKLIDHAERLRKKLRDQGP